MATASQRTFGLQSNVFASVSNGTGFSHSSTLSQRSNNGGEPVTFRFRCPGAAPIVFPQMLVSRGGLDLSSCCLAPFEISVLGERGANPQGGTSDQRRTDGHRGLSPQGLYSLRLSLSLVSTQRFIFPHSEMTGFLWCIESA